MVVQFSSVAQSCLTLCDPMDCNMPGFPVHHQLPELAQTHVLRVAGPTISSSVVPFSSCFQSFPASGSFPMSQFFTSSGQSIGVSASTSFLSMNIQDWFPLGWTGLIPLQSKDSQESSPTPQFQSINSSAFSFLYSPTLTSIHDYWKNFCVRSIIYCLKYPLPPTSMERTCSVNPQCWTWSCSSLGFDCVDHNKLRKILKEMGIPDHLTCLMRNLYGGQEATVRTRCGMTDWF